MSDEHRKHRRFEVEVAGEVVIDREVLGVSTQNLSAGGVGLLLERELEDGREIAVSLFLTQDGIEDPDREPFEGPATVKWIAERDDGLFLVGVQFGTLDAAASRRLEEFLEAIG